MTAERHVAIGQQHDTAFAEISPGGKLIYLERLPRQLAWSIWHEIRSYRNYIIVGSEAVGQGIQIFIMQAFRLGTHWSTL